MKSLFAIIICGLMLHACSKDNLSSTNSEIQNNAECSEKITLRTNYYLFGAIQVTTNLQGHWEFVDNLTTVAAQVDEIVIDSSEILTVVDDFGFAFDSDSNQYFFATENLTVGTLSYYMFLDSSFGAIITTNGGGQFGTGWTCENKYCCDKCVVHQTLGCPCHRTIPACYLYDPPATPSCTKKPGVITA